MTEDTGLAFPIPFGFVWILLAKVIVGRDYEYTMSNKSDLLQEILSEAPEYMTHDPRVLDCDRQVKQLPAIEISCAIETTSGDVCLFARYEGTLYISLEQHDHNWVVYHVKHKICL